MAYIDESRLDNDSTIMAAYGCPTTMTESEIVARLFTLYNELTNQ